MAKDKIRYVCQSCGYDSSKWLGKCPECGAWNSFSEEVLRKEPSRPGLGNITAAVSKPCPITEVDISALPRMSTGSGEMDRVLGGGLVPGSLLLVGGDPGIGKSTLLLQVAAHLSQGQAPVLYVSGEESAAQTRMRAERLGRLQPRLWVQNETRLDDILRTAQECKPALLVIDSIQTMYCPELPSAPGSVGQVRECTGRLLRLAKEEGISIAIIGHVTKDGQIAGPRLLEHMVDVVLYFEGERSYTFRVLRAIKNRFGSTQESGLFAMEEDGLVEVENPSAVLLAERPVNSPGSVVLAHLEGVRPLLLEVQALVSTTCFGMPRRTAAGFDYNRTLLLLAVLEKRVGLVLGDQDVYVNTIGGIRMAEPAADLAVAVAIASSFRNRPVDPHTVVMGEVGLTGEIRMVPRAELRIQEAWKMGFRRFVLPAGNLTALKQRKAEAEYIGVRQVAEALAAVLQ